ncbi:leucine rich adaptor protein 1-like [Arapaima gigas]
MSAVHFRRRRAGGACACACAHPPVGVCPVSVSVLTDRNGLTNKRGHKRTPPSIRPPPTHTHTHTRCALYLGKFCGTRLFPLLCRSSLVCCWSLTCVSGHQVDSSLNYSRVTAGAMEGSFVPDFRDVEAKLGRRVPPGLLRSIAEEPGENPGDEKPDHRDQPERSAPARALLAKMLFLKQQMVHLRAVDVRLMRQLLSINEGIESIKWMMEEKGCLASRDSSLAGSLYSLSESLDTSPRGSRSSLLGASDGADGLSVGSFLDTLADEHAGQAVLTDMDSSQHGPTGENFLDKPPLGRGRNMDLNEYHSFR